MIKHLERWGPSKSVLLLSGPEDDGFGEVIMQFRLTYEGELRPTQRDPENSQLNPLAEHKHQVRKAFHSQLKRLWEVNKFLRECETEGGIIKESPSDINPQSIKPPRRALKDVLADRYNMFGYRFVPLVVEDFSLLCSLKVLFLRRDFPGSVIQAGDIDNRIKTLIDALRIPSNQTELVNSDVNPGDGEDPFFCLMEDDKQVSHLEVETDVLLDEKTEEEADERKVRLIITVELRPYDVSMFNLSFS